MSSFRQSSEAVKTGERARFAPRVLMVSRERATACAFREALREAGFDAFHTTNEERALCALANAHYCALVLDLHSLRVDGFAMVHAVRHHPPTRSMAIVALSPFADAVTEDLAHGHGCDRVLVGRVEPPGLATALDAVLANGGRAAAA